ncbi:hypothetical protein AAFF_G00009910 [Aldrovandia affinis]|uniref:Uncharacterized protein n=1 Tax=Aldrovandia affinis TaxID=143900 RepID=A0AAD7WHG9_9TELE|nr:hypothetical protein AAFF_G00009910 [Aldrovandia affinis]
MAVVDRCGKHLSNLARAGQSDGTGCQVQSLGRRCEAAHWRGDQWGRGWVRGREQADFLAARELSSPREVPELPCTHCKCRQEAGEHRSWVPSH